MNDNIFGRGGTRLPAEFLITEKWFDFFRLFPDFIEVDVHDRRVRFGAGRKLTVQTTDRHSFLHVTVYRFLAT